jgi:uncharacterized membrane protein YphA (DoxX/SURF4 family)
VTSLRARWLWLRALGGIFLSAFLALWFQIEGLIGPRGISPAGAYLDAVRQAFGLTKGIWFAPTLYWLGSGRNAIIGVVVAGLIASIALLLNLWPRAAIVVAGIAFLSFVAAGQQFAQYQSDGMLLEAAFLSFFFAPRGLRPGLGATQPWPKLALWLLRYEWFRIWFESGLVKILSGEPQWRDLTAMDKYYENGPLPTWIAWYVHQWPHGFHAFTAALTLAFELFVVWLIFFGRRPRLVAFALTTPMQLAIILTANYAFLNYIVLFLGVLLLDDPTPTPQQTHTPRATAVILGTHALTSTVMFFAPAFPLAQAVSPFRIANSYGLFAVMTRARYEVEFQGTADGVTWVAYPFRYKPQDLRTPPGIYAPYQPRFDWNLWFASLGEWQNDAWVVDVERRLLANEPDVLALFAGNPFAKKPPLAVRSVRWQYWFTTRAERRATGAWWKREYLGDYAPAVGALP